MFEISFANRISLFFPMLKRDLRIAHLPVTPLEFINKNIKTTALYAFLFTILFFFVLQKAELSFFLLIPIFMIMSILIFEFSIVSIKSKIRQREREINKEVLFVGRYLLVKLYSGRPLLNALIEISSSKGITAKYIKEIVDDIGTGSTIEDALRNAMNFSPSDKLRKVLFHINNALQLGIDVTKPLESVLEEITKEEEIEIKKYGKKLNTLVIFYMLAAVILPSLGVAIFIVISSFVSFPISLQGLIVFVFFIVVLEFIFMTVFKSVRPMVNL
ncbi:hypothetical protein CMO83_03785 [Candidatus Woesearchaeota archaeon]|nr:hypothetical protein [Candidatus Woesearchaeota archaeon]